MACDLPVITTRFGGLPDIFKENGSFHHVQSSDQILNKQKEAFRNNREKIMPYTWERIAHQLVENNLLRK